MATNAAAAALFAAALPRTPIASTSTSNHPNNNGLPPLRGGRGLRRGNLNSRGGGNNNSSGRGGGRMNRGGPNNGGDDSMMVEDNGNNNNGRGRQGPRHAPMGERPLMRVDGKVYRPVRNGPTVLREEKAMNKSGKPTGSTIETLKVFLTSRYSPEAKLLNLENMADDPVLKAAGLKAPGEPDAPKNIPAVIWKLAAELFPEIESLSLANNNLRSILVLSPFLLTTSLPNLQNVSLASNLLKDFRNIDPLSPSIGKMRDDLKPKGWKSIKELVLTGNPLVGTGDQLSHYQREIARRFPSLRQLDQQPIDPSIAFVSTSRTPNSMINPGLSSASKSENAKKRSTREPVIFPLKVTSGFFESEGTRDFVAGFLMKFFSAYDNDRRELLPAYASTSTFSFYADTANPIRSRAKKIGSHNDKKFPNQHKLDWKPYLGMEGSRNILRVKNPIKIVATLKTNPESIISTLLGLPKTNHPLTEPDKFVFDTWTMPGLLDPVASGMLGDTVIYAVLHGQFAERPSGGVRSFDRTFILAPVPAESPAQLAGWPCIILSDVLAYRGYSDPKVWEPESAISNPAPAPVEVSVAPIAAPASEILTPEQQSLVMQLQQITNLTPAFAHLCLVQNGWNPTEALSNFTTLHSQGGIPPEAYNVVA